MARHEMLMAEEIETTSDWCNDCHRETLLTVAYYVTPLKGMPYMDIMTFCEECDSVEIEET